MLIMQNRLFSFGFKNLMTSRENTLLEKIA